MKPAKLKPGQFFYFTNAGREHMTAEEKLGLRLMAVKIHPEIVNRDRKGRFTKNTSPVLNEVLWTQIGHEKNHIHQPNIFVFDKDDEVEVYDPIFI